MTALTPRPLSPRHWDLLERAKLHDLLPVEGVTECRTALELIGMGELVLLDGEISETGGSGTVARACHWCTAGETGGPAALESPHAAMTNYRRHRQAWEAYRQPAELTRMLRHVQPGLYPPEFASAALDEIRKGWDAFGDAGGLPRLLAALDTVLALADQAEHGATRWEDPLPVPPWVAKVRAAIAMALAGEGEG